jgi:hypothetical protein
LASFRLTPKLLRTLPSERECPWQTLIQSDQRKSSNNIYFYTYFFCPERPKPLLCMEQICEKCLCGIFGTTCKVYTIDFFQIFFPHFLSYHTKRHFIFTVFYFFQKFN